MTKYIAVILLLVTSVFAFSQSSPSGVASVPDPASEIDKLFMQWNSPDSPGAAVVVVKDGKVLHQNTYGSASLEFGAPVTASTVFDVASVSKQFAGLAIAMLVDQKRISLEDDVHKYIPELPDFGKRITVGHLVHHTSGLRDWPEVLQAGGWLFDDVISFEQIMTMVQHQRGLNFNPGDEEMYSNTNYNLLARIVERVTGQTFREWTDANIFKPLGMRNTHFHDDYADVVKNCASSYYPTKTGTWKRNTDNLTALGSSSLFTTIEDMAEWLKNFDAPRVGSEAVLKMMVTPGKLNSGKDNNYAFGLFVGRPYRGLQVVSHTGLWAGFRTAMVRFPEQKFSVAVFSNASNFRSLRTANAIAELYLGAEMKEASEVPAVAETPRAPVSRLSQARLQEFAGEYYSHELAVSYSVTAKDDGLDLLNRHYPPLRLTLIGSDEFGNEDWRVRFTRNKSGKITGLLLSGERVRNMSFTRTGSQCF